jgi:Glycosyl hydrolases family 18
MTRLSRAGLLLPITVGWSVLPLACGSSSGSLPDSRGSSSGVSATVASGSTSGAASAGSGSSGSGAGAGSGVTAAMGPSSGAALSSGSIASGGASASSGTPSGTSDAGATSTSDAGNGSPDAVASTDTGAFTDALASTDTGASTDAVEFAPYFPTWAWGGNGYAYTSLVDLMHESGVKDVTIAFVLSNGGCKADNGIEQNLADVKAFVGSGGHVKASFGGADGTYLEAKCTDAASWATALEDFVDATGITDLDFDIEQDPVLTDSVNQMRGQALAAAQAAKNIQVAFTLAANPPPGGLTSQGLSVVSHALAAGVHVSHVNLMTMDYGDSFAGKPLAPVVTGSLTGAHGQLMKLAPTLTAAQVWRMIGVIPMIGKNDDSEVFTVADAMSLEQFAVQNRIGLVSFWSMDRDQVCAKGADYNSCSTVDSTNFEFATALLPVTAH